MNTNFATMEGTEPKRWMIVEDNEDLLAMLSSLLKFFTDAQIESFNSPQPALEAFATAPEKYELVITDFEMPGLNGMELCRRMQTIDPAQKMVLATGSGFFTEAAARHAGFSTLLNKPFLPAILERALVGTGLKIKPLCAA